MWYAIYILCFPTRPTIEHAAEISKTWYPTIRIPTVACNFPKRHHKVKARVRMPSPVLAHYTNPNLPLYIVLTIFSELIGSARSIDRKESTRRSYTGSLQSESSEPPPSLKYDPTMFHRELAKRVATYLCGGLMLLVAVLLRIYYPVGSVTSSVNETITTGNVTAAV